MAVNVYDGGELGGWFGQCPCSAVFSCVFLPREIWSEPEAKKGLFAVFFQKASVASGCYLLILLLAIFLYFRPMNFSGMRQLNLVPFSQILRLYSGVFEREIPMG